MTPSEIAKLITITLAACPTPASFLDAQAIEDMRAAWSFVLDDIDAVDAVPALKRVLAEGDGKIPAPGQIRRIVDMAAHGRKRHGGDAWGDVLREVGRTGRYRRPQFSDAVTARVVDRLGWVELCDSENTVADRARFVELYDKLAAEHVSDRAVATLHGVARPALPSSPAAELVASTAAELACANVKRLTKGGAA